MTLHTSHCIALHSTHYTTLFASFHMLFSFSCTFLHLKCVKKKFIQIPFSLVCEKIQFCHIWILIFHHQMPFCWRIRQIHSCETVLQRILGCVYHLSQVRNAFQYPLSKRVCKRLPKHVSQVVAFIIELVSRERVERNALSLHSCSAQFDPWSRDHVGRAPLRRSVGDINAFQNDFAFIISTETCFWLKRVSDRTFLAFLTP